MPLISYTNGELTESSALDPAATVSVAIPAYSGTTHVTTARNESGNAISLWSEAAVLWRYVIAWPYETDAEFDFNTTDMAAWIALFERLSIAGVSRVAQRYAEIELDPDHTKDKVYGIVAFYSGSDPLALSLPNHVVSGEYLGLVPRAMDLLLNPVSHTIMPGEQVLIGIGLFTTASAEPRTKIEVRF